MKYHAMGASAVSALLISASLATAQTTTTPTFESTLTTGIVGWAPATQTAQLNVLNVGANFAVVAGTTSTTPTSACPLELEFHDAQNNVLKTLEVSSLAPGTAVSLTLKLADLTAAPTGLRVDIRGVVKSNPLSTGPIPAGSATGTAVNLFSACSTMPTLELFDNATGVTQIFTSNTRPVATLQVVPLMLPN